MVILSQLAPKKKKKYVSIAKTELPFPAPAHQLLLLPICQILQYPLGSSLSLSYEIEMLHMSKCPSNGSAFGGAECLTDQWTSRDGVEKEPLAAGGPECPGNVEPPPHTIFGVDLRWSPREASLGNGVGTRWPSNLEMVAQASGEGLPPSGPPARSQGSAAF